MNTYLKIEKKVLAMLCPTSKLKGLSTIQRGENLQKILEINYSKLFSTSLIKTNSTVYYEKKN